MSHMNEMAFDDLSLLSYLENQIDVARIEMQQLWDERGYPDNDVLQASIRLDGLLNKYQKMQELMVLDK